ncbi:hypothetical protein [Labrys miyagiensis]|uniref:hypothetical protein n=1 Tax=Labrys miyagiensis TaxID=346912 RepID=UPI0024E07BF3|nr:hypothetical protein [Labrys miyagiensis]
MVLSMSRMEIDRVHVLRDLLAERIRTREAVQLIGVTTRQVFGCCGPIMLAVRRR